MSLFEVWRHDGYGWVHDPKMTYRWRWWADLVAWERTRRGWFKYEVRES